MISQTQSEGRETRLARVIELLEACQEMGEALDPAMARAVLEDAEAVMTQEQERFAPHLPKGFIPVKAVPEDYRDASALILAARVLFDVATCIQLRKKPGKLRNRTLALRDQVLEEVVKPLLMGMNPVDAAQVMQNAGAWDYTLWSPEHQSTLKGVLEAVASGGYIRREVRDGAKYFLEMLLPSTEKDRAKKAGDRGE